MNCFSDVIHYEAVPEKVKHLLNEKDFNNAISIAVNFYQEYDMGESFKLIITNISKETSLSKNDKIALYSQLLDIILLFYPTSIIGRCQKTNMLYLLTLEIEKTDPMGALRFLRNLLSSLHGLFSIEKIGDEDRRLIFKTVIAIFRRLGHYKKSSDKLNDDISNSIIEKLRVEYKLPKGLLLPRKPFNIDE